MWYMGIDIGGTSVRSDGLYLVLLGEKYERQDCRGDLQISHGPISSA